MQIMTTLVKTNREGAKKHIENTDNGVILIGDVGVGKTTLIRSPRMVSANRLALEYQASGIEAVKALINNQIYYQGMRVVIDDLGIEERVKNFGSELDPINYIIQTIYEINQTADQKIKLYLSTNLNEFELTERYGKRLVDRIWEMCDRVVINDSNLRRKANT